MIAYSRLKNILQQQDLSVIELHRRIRGKGLQINVKSLYRLNDEFQPLERLDMRVAGAICQVCAIPLSDWIVFEITENRFLKLSEEKQEHLDALMTKNSNGELSEIERGELKLLVREAEEITLANARLLTIQRHNLAKSTSESMENVS